MFCSLRGGPEGAWRLKKYIYVWGRAGKGRGGGGILLLGDGPVEGVAVEGGFSLDIYLVWQAGRLCSPFSRGCTETFKGRERGCRIALG